MEGFKTLPKMQCFKDGGAVTKKVVSKVKKPAVPKVSKKDAGPEYAMAAPTKDTAPDPGAPSMDAPMMKKGGRAKKETGTVKKYKVGGMVENQYAAKKTDKDIKDIANTKRQKPAKLCGGGSMKKYAEGGFIDSVKEAGTKLKENVIGTPEQNKTAQENLDKQAAAGSKLAKVLGGNPAKKVKSGVVKKNIGGPVTAAPQPTQPGLGTAQPSGPMGAAAPGSQHLPGQRPNIRVGY